MRIADFLEAGRDGKNRKVRGLGVGDLIPVERRGNARVRQGTDGIRGAGGAILRVLVVVKEDAVTLLLPPFGTGQGRDTPLDGTREGDGGAPHLLKVPTWLNANVDMHAARTTGFRPAAKADLFEKRLHLERDHAHIRPGDARAGIEVD